jgi:hypothetical protein
MYVDCVHTKKYPKIFTPSVSRGFEIKKSIREEGGVKIENNFACTLRIG